MPNNINARREKDKKKQSKKKKTDPPPLHKEDKASMDSSSSSLSLAGTDKANMDSNSLSLSGTDTTADLLDPGYADLKESALLLRFIGSLTLEGRKNMRNKIREANPGASKEEIKGYLPHCHVGCSAPIWKKEEPGCKGFISLFSSKRNGR